MMENHVIMRAGSLARTAFHITPSMELPSRRRPSGISNIYMDPFHLLVPQNSVHSCIVQVQQA